MITKSHKLLSYGFGRIKANAVLSIYTNVTQGQQLWSCCQCRQISHWYRNSVVLIDQKYSKCRTPFTDRTCTRSMRTVLSVNLYHSTDNCHNQLTRFLKLNQQLQHVYKNGDQRFQKNPFCSCTSNVTSALECSRKSLFSSHKRINNNPLKSVLCTSCVYFHSMNNLEHLCVINSKKTLLEPRSYGVTQQHQSFSLTPKRILEASPSSFQPYMRLIRFDKPIGTWLLFWPCTWSIAMAADPGHLPDFWLLGLFGAGSFFMRGAGCIINDMWDRDFDKKVERTKLRPLASGELTFNQGLGCLAGMLSISLGILLQLNWYSVILGSCSMLLVIVYPLAKRFTYWPQALLGVTLNWGVLISWSAIHGRVEWPVLSLYVACVLYTMIYDSIYSHQVAPLSLLPYFPLGLTFNYGAILGWSAVTGSVDLSVVLPLYFSGFVWTLSYDTIYAHQDKYDDMLIGVKSTALKFGDSTKKWLAGFGCIMVSGLTTTGIMCDQTWPFYAGVGLTASHLAYQILTVDLNNADDCAAKFRANSWLGFIMFTAVVMGTLLKPKQDKENIKGDNSVTN